MYFERSLEKFEKSKPLLKHSETMLIESVHLAFLIWFMSSINIRKNILHFAHQQSSVECMHRNVCQRNRVIVAVYNFVLSSTYSNWSPYWITTFLREIILAPL